MKCYYLLTAFYTHQNYCKNYGKIKNKRIKFLAKLFCFF